MGAAPVSFHVSGWLMQFPVSNCAARVAVDATDTRAAPPSTTPTLRMHMNDEITLSQRYSAVAVLLHWLMFAGILVATVMALYMVSIPGITPAKLRLFNYHKWLGVCLWLVLMLRMLWRLKNPPPPLPDAMPLWQKRAAALGHSGLYVLMFAIPVLGYFYSLAAGYPVVLFGQIPLPVMMAPDPELKELLKTAHRMANQLLWLVLLTHVGAALKHALIDRDGIMQRMLPSGGTTGGQRGVQ